MKLANVAEQLQFAGETDDALYLLLDLAEDVSEEDMLRFMRAIYVYVQDRSGPDDLWDWLEWYEAGEHMRQIQLAEERADAQERHEEATIR